MEILKTKILSKYEVIRVSAFTTNHLILLCCINQGKDFLLVVILGGPDQMFERNQHKLAVAQQPPTSHFSHDYCSPSCASPYIKLDYFNVRNFTVCSTSKEECTHECIHISFACNYSRPRFFFSPTNVKADLLLHMTQWQISPKSSSGNVCKKRVVDVCLCHTVTEKKTEWAVCREKKKKYKITIVSVVNNRKKRKFDIFMEWIHEATSTKR